MAPGVDPILAETMQRDPNPGVRAHAIFAASFRDLTTYADPLAQVAQSAGWTAGKDAALPRPRRVKMAG